MASPKSEFLEILSARGFVHQTSAFEAIDALAARGALVAYVGYDCTSPSLHVGSLISIMMLRWLQRSGGGKPLILMGGATTRVGDPSGKDETRQLRSAAEIETNKNGIQRVFAKLLAFGNGKSDALMLDNAEWLSTLNLIDFLRDVGRHFSVNRMLTMDSVRNRLERNGELSFLEFSYMLLQAYDFVELGRRYGCNVQMGGSDQWGNIVMGIELGRRMALPFQLHALTCPLLTTASGVKMGKTASGAVWLDEERRSAYDYWQFWRDTDDSDVARFLRLFTELPLDEIDRLASLRGAEINEAKRTLATEATALLHGRAKAAAAAATAHAAFDKGLAPEDLPAVDVPRAELEAGLGVLSAFVRAGLARSNAEARREIAGGALRINGQRVTDERAILTLRDARDGVIKLSFGKKRHVLLKST